MTLDALATWVSMLQCFHGRPLVMPSNRWCRWVLLPQLPHLSSHSHDIQRSPLILDAIFCHGFLLFLFTFPEAFLSSCAIWSQWPLRSICLCELRASNIDALGEALYAAAPKVLRATAVVKIIWSWTILDVWKHGLKESYDTWFCHLPHAPWVQSLVLSKTRCSEIEWPGPLFKCAQLLDHWRSQGLQHMALKGASASLLEAFLGHELELLDLRLGPNPLRVGWPKLPQWVLQFEHTEFWCVEQGAATIWPMKISKPCSNLQAWQIPKVSKSQEGGIWESLSNQKTFSVFCFCCTDPPGSDVMVGRAPALKLQGLVLSLIPSAKSRIVCWNVQQMGMFYGKRLCSFRDVKHVFFIQTCWGYNPAISQVAFRNTVSHVSQHGTLPSEDCVQQLLASSWANQLHLLDLSECSALVQVFLVGFFWSWKYNGSTMSNY